MEYNIEVKELLLEEDRLTLTVMGTVTDDIINSHFVSKPKVILHFINKKEDRRIPSYAGEMLFLGQVHLPFGFAFLENARRVSAL